MAWITFAGQLNAVNSEGLYSRNNFKVNNIGTYNTDRFVWLVVFSIREEVVLIGSNLKYWDIYIYYLTHRHEQQYGDRSKEGWGDLEVDKRGGYKWEQKEIWLFR